MPYQGKIKRKVVTQQEDIILLRVCIDQLPCLQSLGNSSYKGLFWKNVSNNFNKQTQSNKTMRQIRNRFKSMHEYYLKIRTSTFFKSSQQQRGDVTEEVVFLQTLEECYTQMSYDSKGILSYKVLKTEEAEEKSIDSTLNEILSISTDDTYSSNASLADTKEIHYESNLDMLDIFCDKLIFDNLESDEAMFNRRLQLTPIQNVLTNTRM